MNKTEIEITRALIILSLTLNLYEYKLIDCIVMQTSVKKKRSFSERFLLLYGTNKQQQLQKKTGATDFIISILVLLDISVRNLKASSFQQLQIRFLKIWIKNKYTVPN